MRSFALRTFYLYKLFEGETFMKKKILLALALVAIMTVLFAISVSATEPVETWNVSATENDNVTAMLYDDGSLVISGTGKMKNWNIASTVPWYYSKIKSVTVEGGVTTIGNEAFSNCIYLTSVVIGNSVTTIGSGAFCYCDSLTSVELPEGVTTIGKEAFKYCDSLTSIVIPDSVTTIFSGAFQNCDSLTIYCEATSQPSGWDSYWNVSNRPVVWGHTHTYDFATDLCVCGAKHNYLEKWDVSATTSDSVYAYLYSDYTFVISGTGKMKDWTKTSRAPWNSSYIKKIKTIIVEEGVTAVGSYAFYESTSLTNVVIPRSVTSIGYVAFSKCTTLKSIAVDENNANYCDVDGNLYTKDKTTLVQYAIGKEDTSFVIPDTVTTIGKCAFEYCPFLKSVVIPEGVTSIGDWTFNSCSSLTIYAEATSKPNGWTSNWNSSKRPVVWGYFDENACLNSIFTFKGYSFSANGGFAVGFDIDYDALAKYEAKTGKTLEIGVVFAGYDNLGGKQPLDQNGEAIALEQGMVVKVPLREYQSNIYDCIIKGITEDLADKKLVIAAYIYDGEAVKYVQENGISDTVCGISYNEAKAGIE